MTRLASGVCLPAVCKAHWDRWPVRFWPAEVAIERIQMFAGSAIGSATISFPCRYARDADPEMGYGCRLTMDGSTVFRGVVGEAPFRIGPSEDRVAVVVFDDKWQMAAEIVGRPGIGTWGTPAGASGFQDVGFEVVFNRDGRPNKKPTELDFLLGSTAEFWTLKTIMRFLFEHYVEADVARLVAADLDDVVWGVVPSHVDLTGQTALQAVDTVSQMAGVSWGLDPQSDHSHFVVVRPGYAGTTRTLRGYRPEFGGRADGVTEWFYDRLEIGGSIRELRDTFVAVCARQVCEHTYTSTGADPLLTRAANCPDKRYATRYVVDVAKYAAHGLGLDLTAGASPKPWLPRLLTRPTAAGSGYVTAAQLIADPTLRHRPPLETPVCWVSLTGLAAAKRLVKGGIRIDCDAALIDCEPTLELYRAGSTEAESVRITEWATLGIWLTVATVLETPLSAAATGGSYLPRAYYQVIAKPDLVPELRRDAWLPDLSSADPNAHVVLSAGATETYVDVTAALTAAADAALDAMGEVEKPVTVELPFFPVVKIGDDIAFTGRPVGAPAKAAVIEVAYNVYEEYRTIIRASNVVAGMEPGRFEKVQT